MVKSSLKICEIFKNIFMIFRKFVKLMKTSGIFTRFVKIIKMFSSKFSRTFHEFCKNGEKFVKKSSRKYTVDETIL